MPTSRSPSQRQHGAKAPTHPASPGSNATLPKASPDDRPRSAPDEVRDFPSGNPEPKGNYK